MIDTLKQYFSDVLRLPNDASDWLLGLWMAIQVFDDMADGDEVDRNDLLHAIVNTLVVMPSNPFFRANVDQLTPVVMLAVLKWTASDNVERAGKADAKSYMWRASYYDVVLLVFGICHGAQYALDNAEQVMRLYGETLEGYLKEFENA